MLFSPLYSQIKAHSSVAGHMLYDLEGVNKSSSTEPTIILVDTTGSVFSGAFPPQLLVGVLVRGKLCTCSEALAIFVFSHSLHRVVVFKILLCKSRTR